MDTTVPKIAIKPNKKKPDIKVNLVKIYSNNNKKTRKEQKQKHDKTENKKHISLKKQHNRPINN